MNPARPAWLLAVPALAAFFLQADLLAQPENARTAREQLEDRLLEGELLEVSAGDLEKAMTVYRALIDQADTPEPVRARALLYLARCHRKLGQVDRAKEYLDRVIEKHTEEREVLRQARAFLRELQGEKLNPEFDWLGELGKSPEIQARVFDLAMDMVDLDGETGQRARRQLLALGSVAVPVLEKMVTTSRDERHRHHLALLLVQMGKLESWKVLLDPKSPLSTSLQGYMRDGKETSDLALVRGLAEFFQSIPALSERDRARLLEILGEIPKDEATEPYRQLILVQAGAVEEFAPAIPALEVLLRLASWQLVVRSLFAERLEQDPEAPKAVAARLLDPECGTQPEYYRLLEQKAPGALGVAHHKLMLELVAQNIERDRHRPGRSAGNLQNPGESHPLIAKLEAAEAFEALEPFATGVLAPNLVDYFWKTHVETGRPGEAPAGWARILRRARPVELKYSVEIALESAPDRKGGTQLRFESGAQVLHMIAETNDSFVDELEDFLQKLEEEAPDYRGYGRRYIWPWLTSVWKPSAGYVDAMEDLLEGARPFATIVALDSLSLATPLADATLERVEGLASRAEDDLVREYALYALVRHFAARPESGPRVARALMAETLRRLDAGPDATGTSLPDSEAFGSVAPRLQRSARVRSRRSSASQVREVGTPQYVEQPGWPVTQVSVTGRDVAIELYPQVVDLTVDEGGRRFHTWYVGECIEDHAQASAILLAKAVEFEQTERKLYALPYLRGLDDAALQSQRARFLKLIATDRQIDVEKRTEAIQQGGDESLKWFDWPEYLRRDDPILDVLAPTALFGTLLGRVKNEETGRQEAFWSAAFDSPHAFVRTRAYGSYPLERPDAVEVLRRGMDDPELGVREQAKTRIAGARTNDMVPLLLALLEDEDRSWRLGAIRALKNLALQESVEPLVKALDDPDFEVRKEALEALKAIRATLEEKEEWQKLLEGLKK